MSTTPTPEAHAAPAPSPETTTKTVTEPTSLLGNEKEPAAPEAPKVEPEFKPLDAAAIKLPEGFTANEPLLGEFLTIANELKLPVDVAQKLVDLQTKLTTQASEAGSKAYGELQTRWQDEVRNDPQIGGQKLEENLSHVAKLIDRFGGDKALAIREAFAETGAGNNPAIVRFMIALAKEHAEPSPVSGKPSSSPADAASLLYPNQGKS